MEVDIIHIDDDWGDYDLCPYGTNCKLSQRSGSDPYYFVCTTCNCVFDIRQDADN